MGKDYIWTYRSRFVVLLSFSVSLLTRVGESWWRDGFLSFQREKVLKLKTTKGNDDHDVDDDESDGSAVLTGLQPHTHLPLFFHLFYPLKSVRETHNPQEKGWETLRKGPRKRHTWGYEWWPENLHNLSQTHMISLFFSYLSDDQVTMKFKTRGKGQTDDDYWKVVEVYDDVCKKGSNFRRKSPSLISHEWGRIGRDLRIRKIG